MNNIDKKKMFVIGLLALLTAAFWIVPAAAAQIGSTEPPPQSSGTLTIDYQEDTEGTEPVVEAGFTAYQVAVLSADGGYEALLPGLGDLTENLDAQELLVRVRKQYAEQTIDGGCFRAVTNQNGIAHMTGLEAGLYLVEESQPAKDHLPGEAFLCAVPQTVQDHWVYDVTAEPKPHPTGKLKVSKVVKGQKEKDDTSFHFTVVFEQYTEPVAYEKSDGTTGTIHSGQSIRLKHQESVVFTGIPVGTAYRVTEQEADMNGYRTTSKDSAGNILRTKVCEAAFTNTQEPPATGDRHLLRLTTGITIGALFVSVIFFYQWKKWQTASEREKRM